MLFLKDKYIYLYQKYYTKTEQKFLFKYNKMKLTIKKLSSTILKNVCV